MKRAWMAVGAVAGAAALGGLALITTGVLDEWSMDSYAQRRMAPFASPRDGGSAPAARTPPPAAASATAGIEAAEANSAGTAARGAFRPPDESAIPEGPYGDVVRRGREIFTDTPAAASAFVGNSLRCSSCHLDAGRLADSAPLWAAWVSYPAYRGKTRSVNTYEQRLQGCFQYSMNGTAPPPGDPVLVALEAYSYWMASGARVDPELPGRGYPRLAAPPQPPDFVRGQAVYQRSCALCHASDGNGQRTADGHAVFPALWGPDSFNWGAGMARLSNAAAFIRANMPLGLPGTLSVQEAWDVALFMNSHERPQDPRYAGSVAETRRRYHDTPDSMYGLKVGTRLLGDSGPPRRGPAPAKPTAAEKVP
ncbi:MAG: c-type cytochrome [Pseudomonadota bacterium]